ncbi:Helix-turn-helix domain protein [Symmachiella dynata]|uniref:Helix-turn-helix domain protein n=1 Tax=Symmachiella dynata TaxID=2527995 RepID=A0A517ZP45_9PLAN|nr:helix-turn-helix domain-containing protein [Symmachiella dynata]QDU44248.1 Helix-turn-helix domain protein [Symmachiella dynata]
MNVSRKAVISSWAEKLLLTSPEAADAMSISQRTLFSLTKSGEIPCVRVGRSVRYCADDLRNWIERQKQGVHSK